MGPVGNKVDTNRGNGGCESRNPFEMPLKSL